MSINSILVMPLILLAGWIIHSQLELRGWSCLHGTSAFSMIHFLSYARGLLIVVYCSLADHMLFLCHRDYSRQRSECLGNEVHYRDPESCFPVKLHETSSRFRLDCTGAINLDQSQVSKAGDETDRVMHVFFMVLCRCNKNTCSVAQRLIFNGIPEGQFELQSPMEGILKLH